jgi:xylulokinase
MVYTFGGAATAGAVIRWFRDTLGETRGPSAYELLAGEAAKIAAGSEGLIALPYFMGERSPIWDVNARGTVTGLTLSHTRAHLYRAMLEGVAYALEHNIEYGIAGNPHLDEALTVVGGAAKSELWLDIIASVTGRPVRASAEAGEAAYGDAMLAAHGIGLVGKGDLPAWTEKNLPNRYRDPKAADRETYRGRYRAYRELYDALRPYFAAQARTAA